MVDCIQVSYASLTRGPAVAEIEPLVRRCLEQPYSMLTMTIPDVEISAVRSFTVRFNVFARWHQHV